MYKKLVLLWIMGMALPLMAQDAPTWSLEKCINYAIENNLQVKQAGLNRSQAQLTEKQSIWAQAPTVNGSARYGLNLGRTIDPTTYEFAVGVLQTANLGVNGNWLLYQGMQVRNTIKQSKIDLRAAEKDVEQAKNDVALSVAQAYLSILLAEESKEVLVEQAKVTKAQYEQTAKLIDGGVLAENSRYDLEAQMARDEENIVIAENNIELAYVNLKVLMNLDVAEAIAIERADDLEVEEAKTVATLEEVYQEALEAQPNIQAAEMRELSAQLGVSIAKGALTPSISFYSNLNTNFSSNFTESETQPFYLDGVVVSTGEPTRALLGERPVLGTQRVIPFFTQLGGNLSAQTGISISVPIFNGLRSRIGIERAELGTRIASLSTEQLKTTLKSNIDRALTDVRAAQKRLAAAQKSVRAIRLSVDNTRRRYELGVVNSFELTSVQNTLVSAESSVLQAKYDYLFKLKILDYYRGRTISIE
jgi:outer membrane protein